MNLGPMEISLVLLAVLLLFGYKKLPDAARSMGRSMRIFKSEMKGMKEDEVAGVPAVPAHGRPSASEMAVEHEVAARAAEARAAELRALAARERAVVPAATSPASG
jgi:sec-independent protein translocase protein TatA